MTKDSTCSTCALWRSRIRPHRDESLTYAAYRPCGDGLRRGLTGGRALSYPSGRVITAPDARCDHWLGRGEETHGH